MKPSQQRAVASIRSELARLARYDDESIVHDHWIRQRYDGGYAVSFGPARAAAVVTAWHEAGHAVAALAIGTDFSSASIYHARDSAGRVHGIRGAGELAFVIDAAGQIAEHLRDWTLPGSDDELRARLAGWTSDGGDARRFRRASAARSGPARWAAERAAWRYSEQLLTPLRPVIRAVARALLVHPRPLSRDVVAAIAGPVQVTAEMSDPPATMGPRT